MKKKRGSDMSGYIQNPGHLIVEAQLSMQWQKIETCPRDGSFILLTDGKEVYQGNFSEKGFWKGTNISRTKLGFGLYPNLPTHWMPLPEYPKED